MYAESMVIGAPSSRRRPGAWARRALARKGARVAGALDAPAERLRPPGDVRRDREQREREAEPPRPEGDAGRHDADGSAEEEHAPGDVARAGGSAPASCADD